jgi:hypothetical protein
MMARILKFKVGDVVLYMPNVNWPLFAEKCIVTGTWVSETMEWVPPLYNVIHIDGRRRRYQENELWEVE